MAVSGRQDLSGRLHAAPLSSPRHNTAHLVRAMPCLVRSMDISTAPGLVLSTPCVCTWAAWPSSLQWLFPLCEGRMGCAPTSLCQVGELFSDGQAGAVCSPAWTGRWKVLTTALQPQSTRSSADGLIHTSGPGEVWGPGHRGGHRPQASTQPPGSSGVFS